MMDMGAVGMYKYRTQSKAEMVAKKLGIDGFHSHQKDGVNGGRRYYMPGETHRELNQALESMGKQPTGATPSMSGGGMMMGSDMDMMGSEMGTMKDNMPSSKMMESETSMSMNMGDPDDLPEFSMIGDETDNVDGILDKDPDTNRATESTPTPRTRTKSATSNRTRLLSEKARRLTMTTTTRTPAEGSTRHE
jgi:hypothetical protein